MVVTAVLALSLMLVSVASAAGKFSVDNQKASLYPVPSGLSDSVDTSAPTQGKVIVVNPMGATNMVISGEATGLTPGVTYSVWVRDLRGGTLVSMYNNQVFDAQGQLGYYKLATFVADDLGNGSFHLTLTEDQVPDNTYSIQVAINCEADGFISGIGKTVLATPYGDDGADMLTVTLNSK